MTKVNYASWVLCPLCKAYNKVGTVRESVIATGQLSLGIYSPQLHCPVLMATVVRWIWKGQAISYFQHTCSDATSHTRLEGLACLSKPHENMGLYTLAHLSISSNANTHEIKISSYLFPLCGQEDNLTKLVEGTPQPTHLCWLGDFPQVAPICDPGHHISHRWLTFPPPHPEYIFLL